MHNLGGMSSTLPDSGYDWAQRFDEQVKETMAEDPADTPAIDRHRDFQHAVPTPDHFIPLLYLAGLASASNRGTDVLIDGYAYGSLSMTAYTLDLPIQPEADEATELPEKFHPRTPISRALRRPERDRCAIGAP